MYGCDFFWFGKAPEGNTFNQVGDNFLRDGLGHPGFNAARCDTIKPILSAPIQGPASLSAR